MPLISNVIGFHPCMEGSRFKILIMYAMACWSHYELQFVVKYFLSFNLGPRLLGCALGSVEQHKSWNKSCLEKEFVVKYNNGPFSGFLVMLDDRERAMGLES